MMWLRRAAASVLAAACFGVAAPASAMPGQTIAQFQAWSAQQKLLRGLVRTTDELSGLPAFDLLTADHGVAWHFHASTAGNAMTSELLGVGGGAGDPGSAPIRHDGTGYGAIFMRSLYGSAVASDFLASSRVASVTDGQSHVVTVFYRGKRYGYESAGGFLTIATLPVMMRDLAQLRACTAHPDRCSE